MKEVLNRFIAALNAEIDYVEKERADQSYELVSGQRDEHAIGEASLYIFILADPSRLPEDAMGILQFGNQRLPVGIVSQEGNRLALRVEGADSLPAFIARATLSVDATQLLVQLKERIEDMRAGRIDVGLSPLVFREQQVRIGWSDPPERVAAKLDGWKMRTVQQALGSDFTMVWGPPGTGKTFTIAALTAALADRGETVLITSHTHAAVEEALWAAIEPASANRPAGLMCAMADVEEGRVLKVGEVRLNKIPPSVRFDDIVRRETKRIGDEIDDVGSQLSEVMSKQSDVQVQLAAWARLQKLGADIREVENRVRAANVIANRWMAERDARRHALTQARREYEAAQRSFWPWKGRRVERTRRAVLAALRAAEEADLALNEALSEQDAQTSYLNKVKATLAAEEEAVPFLRSEVELQQEATELERIVRELQTKLDGLRIYRDRIASEILAGARVVFATLTKAYMDPDLREKTFDAVIIDEASMAMPPLVAFVASRARKSIVLVGDFYQLPPIVQSGQEFVQKELGRSIFDLWHIPRRIEHREKVEELTELDEQRRMHPQIASVARQLTYRDRLHDHHSVGRNGSPEWVDSVLPSRSRLVAVDVSGMRPWSGRVPGSLSRFNFYTAEVSCDLAAGFAASIGKPRQDEPAPIGIVTPYTAQRRYLSRLVEALGLKEWVTPGTVHTFQGNECDLIIFDSVLSEPFWTARLVTPNLKGEVLREMNVAVTRARHRLVFIGDFRWLDKHATQENAMGQLWTYLREHAWTVKAEEVVSDDFLERVASLASMASGWSLDATPVDASFLTEQSFYPAFLRDLASAKERVVLFTTFIGKTRWPQVESAVRAAAGRPGVEVFLVHKPLSDPEWKSNREFGNQVLSTLEGAGVKLIGFSGIHAKTVIIDDEIVYEGSLNWASQTASREHMWRFRSREMAAVTQHLYQLEPILETFTSPDPNAWRCPNCGGKLMVINQRQMTRFDRATLKLGCVSYAADKASCPGHLRAVSARPPFKETPRCERGSTMDLTFGKSGRPGSWVCGHKGCEKIRWVRGDPVRGRPASRQRLL